MTMSLRLNLPLLPLRDVVVYPHMVLPLFVGREKSIEALETGHGGRQAGTAWSLSATLPTIIPASMTSTRSVRSPIFCNY